MRISEIKPYNPLYQNKVPEKKAQSTVKSSVPSYAAVSSENIKARFMLSFGAMIMVGEVEIKDRKTGETTRAELKQGVILNEYVTYKMYSGDEHLGFEDIRLDAEFPKYDKNKAVNKKDVPFDVFPEIEHLRTLAGDKYAGIGTALVKLAVKESFNAGKEGALWLITQKGYMRTASPYRSGENPIPFYYKLGFRASGDKDAYIQKCLNEKRYDLLPDSALLVLTPDAAKKLQTK